MEQSLFRSLEYFNILYDIAIDEEDYNHGCCEIEFRIDDEVPFRREDTSYYLDLDVVNDFSNISFTIDRRKIDIWNPPQDLEMRLDQFTMLDNGVSAPAKRLLLAKHARADIQNTNDSQAINEYLDRVALFLLRNLPDQSSNDLSGLPWCYEAETFLLRIMYLNEVAACFVGEKSAGFADTCLSLIKACLQPGRTPYELVALYNKAMERLHIKSYEEALNGFTKVIDASLSDYSQIESWYSWSSEDEALITNYIINQSILMRSDTLINQQMTEDAETQLRTCLKEPLSQYKESRKQLLLARVALDKHEQDSEDVQRAEQIVSDKRGLCSTQRSVGLEDLIIKSERLIAKAIVSGLREESCQQISDALETLQSVIRTQIKSNDLDKAEMDQAINTWSQSVLLWSKDINSIADVSTVSLFIEKICDLLEMTVMKLRTPFNVDMVEIRVLDMALNLLCDQEYRDLKNDTRKCVIESAKELTLCLDEVDIEENPRNRLRPLLQTVFNELSSQYTSDLCEYDKQDLRLWCDIVNDKFENTTCNSTRSFLAKRYFDSGGHHINEIYCLKCILPGKNNYSCFRCQRLRTRVKKNQAVSPLPANSMQKSPRYEHYHDQLIATNRLEINRRLYAKQEIWRTPSGWGFVVLQRWNSYTPALAASEGGGYFLYHAAENGAIDIGIIIDPGYGFLRNYLRTGFGIRDITSILISHNHPDHLQDFGAILNLVHEANKNRFGDRTTPELKIDVYLSKGAHGNLKQIIDSASNIIRDTRLIEPQRWTTNRYINIDNNEKTARAIVDHFTALHKDASGEDGLGFIVTMRSDRDQADGIIGFTCDTRWSDDYLTSFNRCNVVCAHLDSLTPETPGTRFLIQDYFNNKKGTVSVLAKKSQLYLPGIVSLCDSLSNIRDDNSRLVILSEFGEELAGGIRTDFAEKLRNNFNRERLQVLPGDVGLFVDPISRQMKCSLCDGFYDFCLDFVCCEAHNSQRICYVCPMCNERINKHSAISEWLSNLKTVENAIEH